MPRTVWEPDPRFSHTPNWNNPSHLRGCAEEFHHDRLYRTWTIPLHIHPATSSDADRGLIFRDIFCRNVGRQLDKLTPDDCRVFCWKDCAIYGNTNYTGAEPIKLFNFIYRQWFPNRAQDKDSENNIPQNLVGATMAATAPLSRNRCRSDEEQVRGRRSPSRPWLRRH